MKRVLNLIYSGNRWYDNLEDTKRFLVFLWIVGLPLVIVQILLYVFNIWYGFPIWAITFLALRLPYLLRPKKTITFDIETSGLFDNKMFLVDFEERGRMHSSIQDVKDYMAMQEKINKIKKEQ